MTKERGRLPFFPQFGQLVFIVPSRFVGAQQSMKMVPLLLMRSIWKL